MTWTAISKVAMREKLSYQLINEIQGNLSHARALFPIIPTVNGWRWMEYQSASQIKMLKGEYYLNGTWYSVASDVTWTWTAGGPGSHNFGLDTGAEAASTVYYLYFAYASEYGWVASTTAPTARNNTNLSGTSYDTNLYVGWFYNDGTGGGDIVKFIQAGPNFYRYDKDVTSGYNHNTGTYASKTLSDWPTTLRKTYGQLRIGHTGDAVGYASPNGTFDWYAVGLYGVPAGTRFGRSQMEMPTDGNTIYLKCSAGTVYYFPTGCYDGFLDW